MRQFSQLNVLFLIFLLAGCQLEDRAGSLLRQAESFMEAHPDSALSLLKQIPEAGRLSGQKRADYCLLMTQSMDKNNLPLQSDSLIRIAVDYYQDKLDSLKKGQAFFYWGRVCDEKGNIKEAQQCYLKARMAVDGTDNKKYQALVCYYLAALYRQQNLYQDALLLGLHSVSLFEQQGDSASLSYGLRDVGRTYLLDGELDSASVYYYKAMDVASQACESGIRLEIVSEWERLLLHLGKSKVTVHALLSSLEKVTDKYPVYLSLGTYYLQELNLPKAKAYFLQATASPRAHTRLAAYRQLRNMELKDVNLIYVTRYERAVDSLHQQEQISAIKEIQEKYDNASLTNQNLELRYEKLHSTIVYLVFVLALGCAVCVVFYFYKREKRCREAEYGVFVAQMQENQKQFNQLYSELDSKHRNIIQLEAQFKKESENFNITLEAFHTDRGDIEKQLVKELDKVNELQGKIEELKRKQDAQARANQVLIDKNRSLKTELDLMPAIDSKEYVKYYQSFCLLVQIRTKPIQGQCDLLGFVERQGLLECIDLIHGNKLKSYLSNHQGLSEDDILICYFIYAKIKNPTQASFFNITSTSLSKRKNRLKDKLHIQMPLSLEQALNGL